MDKPNVTMTKDGQQAEVANNDSVAVMEAQGWKVVPDKAAEAKAKAEADAKAKAEAAAKAAQANKTPGGEAATGAGGDAKGATGADAASSKK